MLYVLFADGSEGDGIESSDPDGAQQNTDQFTSIKYNDGFKGHSESMTDFLYDFITLFPPRALLSAHRPHGKNNTKFNIKK